MIKFKRPSKKKQEKGRSQQGGSSHYHSSGHHMRGDQSVSSAYSAHSQYSAHSEYTNETGYSRNHGSSYKGGTHEGSRRISSGTSVASISTTSVFAPSVAPDRDRDAAGLTPSSSRTLHDLNSSRRSSLLTSIGTAASRTFRSYKMTLPRAPPPIRSFASSGGGEEEQSEDVIIESDLELLGRTVHAVSSALTEPPKDGDKFMIYDVSFNPKGCVWDALIVVQLNSEEEGEDENGKGERRSSSRSRSRSKSRGRKEDSGGEGDGPNGWDMSQTFSFPIRVTCAEDDDYEDPPPPNSKGSHRKGGQQPNIRRAKTYAVDLSVVDDAANHPISRWTQQEMADHRDDIKNAMEWVSYGIRRSMARSMFPQFPEGCQGRPFREVYQLNKKLKSGTFSTVCRGVHRATGRQVAVKCILRKKIEPSVDAAVFEEVLIMSGLHHRYICPMIDYFEEDRCHFVVMELEKGGDLCERLNEKVTYSEADARTVVRNICEAMDFVHSKGFAHCDIKPRNYLLRSKRDDTDVRLADFGFAQHVHAPNSLTSQCGTPFFVAPEVINRKPYDQKVDMWSIGVTAYLLLCGETPFNGKNRQQLFRRISCDEPTYPDEKWGHISDEAVDFVSKLLAKDPEKRLSAAGALRHRWLADHVSNEKVVEQSSEDFSELTDPSRSRDPPEYYAKNTPSVHSNTTAPSTSYSSNAAPTTPYNNASKPVQKVSPVRKHPPPPPPPQAPPRDVPTSPGAGYSSSSNHNTSADENARLLDVIKEQDAKIEKLERMVKRMLEPEGAVHEC